MKTRNGLTLILLLLVTTATLIGCGGVSTSLSQKNSSAEGASATQAQALNPDNSTVIGEEKAKSIALEHAGLSETDVTFVRTYLDYDDGHPQYDVEFYGGNAESDYDIDAITGEILSHDRDAEYYVPPKTETNTANSPAGGADSNVIGEAKAKSIALKHAKVKEGNVTFVHTDLDYDDGRQEYNVEFYSGNVEYDYEIDAVTGKILSYDRDAEYYVPAKAPAPAAKAPAPAAKAPAPAVKAPAPAAKAPTPAVKAPAPATKAPAPAPASPPASNSTASSPDIGEAKAKKIALAHAGYSESKVRRLIVGRDYDNGKLEYEVEFYVGNIEYNYEIDAASGNIIDYEAEQDD